MEGGGASGAESRRFDALYEAAQPSDGYA
jgi:hypothetical protein